MVKNASEYKNNAGISFYKNVLIRQVIAFVILLGRKFHILKGTLVYVIGLHAVQFGNNWMKKIPRTAKIGRGRRPSPIWLSEKFFESNYFQIGQACSPLTY